MASAFIGLLDFVLEGVNKAKIHGFFEDGVVFAFFSILLFCWSTLLLLFKRAAFVLDCRQGGDSSRTE